MRLESGGGWIWNYLKTSSYICLDPELGWMAGGGWLDISQFVQSLHMAWASSQHGGRGVVKLLT